MTLGRPCSGPWVRGPAGRLDAELLRVLGVQSLPAAELHGVWADDASNRVAREEPFQHIEADMPAGRAHGDVSTVDVVPESEPGTAAERLQFPADVISTPVIFERLRRVSPLDLALGDVRRRRSYRRELCGADGPEVPVGIE